MVRSKFTEFRGQVYRSRTEARWAAVFHALDVPFEYEPKVFSTTAGKYCPDFKVGKSWIEVKPVDGPTDDRSARKICALSAIQEDPVYIFCGKPEVKCFGGSHFLCNFGIHKPDQRSIGSNLPGDRLVWVLGITGYVDTHPQKAHVDFAELKVGLVSSISIEMNSIPAVQNLAVNALQLSQELLGWTRLGKPSQEGLTMQLHLRDDDGELVGVGDRVVFSYGIPPIRVVAEVVERGGELIVLTPGHKPTQYPLARLRGCVGDWLKEG